MKILRCDCCHVEVNDFAHWYNDEKPRNIYEMNCIHESNSDTYDGMIFCHECLAKLLYKAESEDCISRQAAKSQETVTEFADRCKECGAHYGQLLKQKTGRWINDKCNKCGASRPPFFDRYCPYCGANMQEGEE